MAVSIRELQRGKRVRVVTDAHYGLGSVETIGPKWCHVKLENTGKTVKLAVVGSNGFNPRVNGLYKT